MLAVTRRSRGRRRGVILILVLGILGLMAVIGITFATLSGQARTGARQHAQSMLQPQRDELFDYALSQLISDTPDIRSAIRGHGMSRDMFGNDANRNGYLTMRPDGVRMAPNNDVFFYITQVTSVGGTIYNLTTNIPSADNAFYGYNFQRWTLRVSMLTTPPLPVTGVVDQSLEILTDDISGPFRIFTVNILPTDGIGSPAIPNLLLNPTVTPTHPAGHTTALPGKYLVESGPPMNNPLGNQRFILDGRWLHAFNGPGMRNDSYKGNFRFSGVNPASAGMDEDYDAADLENWFLALQSADGSVMIPSFHRPGIIRYDTTTGLNDWLSVYDGTDNTTWAPWRESAQRILRPRAADGHDTTAFPDILPGNDGTLTFDVDNDGDGKTDSVWLDLGYPARPNAQGQLYKPLFAFMVIGLNGKIPLNTAGNLAGGGSTHATHLGNSVSEIDPTYGLQNGFATGDALNAFVVPVYGGTYTGNFQLDSGGIDVRLTQLRNLLAGTRPQVNPSQADLTGLTNGDNNLVVVNGTAYFMPNGIAEPADSPLTNTDSFGNSPPQYILRTTPPVAGRWGEDQSVPGYPSVPNTSPPPPFRNLVTNNYNNRIRPGYSLDATDLYYADAPRDAADDNKNSFDPYPSLAARTGEVGDLDFLDLAGAYIMPVERMRRYVTPADINGTGQVVQWDGVNNNPGPNRGPDAIGRVEFNSYYRPPGLPGMIDTGPGTTPVSFPWPTGDPYPETMVTNAPPTSLWNNNNPLHGFLSQCFPNLNYTGGFRPQRVGGVPVDINTKTAPLTYLPGTFPTYDMGASSRNPDGLNEADELNLYTPNAQLDSPFGYADLEWLYRRDDVDGLGLSSRLAHLAPISFDQSINASRSRKLFSIDTWESTGFSWANDRPSAGVNTFNPPATGLGFANNSRFGTGDSGVRNFTTTPALPAGMTLPVPTPSLMHRDRKINLNYPLPVSNDPNEAVRQKWIADTYFTLKAILPPLSVDTPEELAQLSQFVINIVDFRDTDATMTHWRNPDIWLRPGATGVSPYVVKTADRVTTDLPVDQYGMEYNPVAINEVLAYSFRRNNGGTSTPTPRFFVELVNTLTSPELGPAAGGGLGTGANNASTLDLAGFLSGGTLTTPWDGACWDIVFTADDPMSRPDPIMGQLHSGTAASFYGLIPLVRGTFGITNDPVINPLPQVQRQAGATIDNFFIGDPAVAPVAPNYFLTLGSPLVAASSEFAPFTPTYTMGSAWDPVDYGSAPPTGNVLPAAGGVLPRSGGNIVLTYPPKIPATVPASAGTAAYYWMCVRRPANPFAPVSESNPMVVVDSIRFPYVEGGGTGTAGSPDTATTGANYLYSHQRLQPYRGGQSVPRPEAPASSDPRYGYTEQIATLQGVTESDSGSYGRFGSATTHITRNFYHTLGKPNAGTVNTATTPYQMLESWDYLPFNDRDFTSVAELMLVPGCPPGLFTKQFVEVAPTQSTVALGGVFREATPSTIPLLGGSLPNAPQTASVHFVSTGNPLPPRTFPYLVDRFFYTASSPTAVPNPARFGDPTGDGWFKMIEFFEVPSQMIGAVGPVAQGMNFDWARQDAKPGLINLNLIIDEEVFFSVFGKQDGSSPFNQNLLNAYSFQLTTNWGGGPWPPQVGAGPWTTPLPAGYAPVPLVVTATSLTGSPTFGHPMSPVGYVYTDPVTLAPGNFMKAAFAQFLTLRHGGSGFLFGYGTGQPGQQITVQLAANNPNMTFPNMLTAPIPADRPFRSLSYPDIDYTVMRPAMLPPSPVTDPMYLAPTIQWPPAYTGSPAPSFDPGLRNPALYQGYLTSIPGVTPTPPTGPTNNHLTQIQLPPAIPLRRLFQPADRFGTSNAGMTGDPYINKLNPTTATSATGALPTWTTGPANLNDNVPTLMWPSTGAPGYASAFLGSGTVLDRRQHPYFRSEMMQKAMNLTTVRTHQYAVWITVGFFQVTRTGDLGILGDPTIMPANAFDTLGPEIGASTGQTTRYRGFFVVDRLKLTGFDPNTPGSFRPAVMYRQTIQ